jgi:molybdenum cofactor cytidylyltransferase
MADITGLLLAAGVSERFGSNKLLANLDGQPLVLHSAKTLKACEMTIAVVRANDHRLQQLLQQAGISIVINHRAEDGMGSSIAAGVKASRESDGWCILPADMPAIQKSTTQVIVDALRGGAQLAVPSYQTHRGHPVGFSKLFGNRLELLNGEIGARSILAAHPDQVVRLAVDDPGILQDIDRPEDLLET